MKKLVFYLAVGFMISFLSGCDLDDEGYYLNDSWMGLGLIQKDTVSENFTIELDNGVVLSPVNNSGWWREVKDNQRFLVNYTIIGDKNNTENTEQYSVRINSLSNILYKGILNITPEIEDSIGNDPIHVKDLWLKKNMLNFELQYPGGSKIHFINLVKPATTSANANDPVILELRHNNKGDQEMIPLSAVVTFDLSSLKVVGKTSISFNVTAKDFDGKNFEYIGEYKY